MRRALPPRLLRPPAILAAAAAVWLSIIVLLVWPALRASRRQATAISGLAARGELLGGWSGGRALLVADATRWEGELTQRFEQLFPRERRLEQLFMAIATAANQCGVDPVQLRAATGASAPDEGRGELLTAGTPGEGREDLLTALGLAPRDFPTSKLRAYRLRLSFDADYEHLARFTDALRGLSRAVSVRSLQVRRGNRGVAVQMELEYYVQERN